MYLYLYLYISPVAPCTHWSVSDWTPRCWQKPMRLSRHAVLCFLEFTLCSLLLAIHVFWRHFVNAICGYFTVNCWSTAPALRGMQTWGFMPILISPKIIKSSLHLPNSHSVFWYGHLLFEDWTESVLCLYGSHPVVFITKQVALFRSYTTEVYFSSLWLPLHLLYMFRRVLRPSLGMSVQKSYRGRYNKNLRAPFYRQCFCNVKA